MSADVVCMSLANVPPGEQRTRFLAVGLVDNTVRIISLDPLVSGTHAGLHPTSQPDYSLTENTRQSTRLLVSLSYGRLLRRH